MGGFIYQWIDLLWLPIGWVVVHKAQRINTAAFIACIILMLRAQVELMERTGFPNGFMPGFLESHVYGRGLVVYGFFITMFLILAYYSPNTKGAIYLAATLSIFIFGFCISMLVMAL